MVGKGTIAVCQLTVAKGTKRSAIERIIWHGATHQATLRSVPAPLLPERHPVRDFFIELDALDVAPRSDMGSMAHPIFSFLFRRSISWLMQKIRMSLSKMVASPLIDGWISTKVSPLT